MTVLPYQPWWRMPEARKRPRTPRRFPRTALLFLGYWVLALSAAYAIHVDVLPARTVLLAAAPTPPPMRIGRTIEMPAPFDGSGPKGPELPAVPASTPASTPLPAELMETSEPAIVAEQPAVEKEQPAVEPRRIEKRRVLERAVEKPRAVEKRAVAPPAPRTKPAPVEREPEPPRDRRVAAANEAGAKPSTGGGMSCEAAVASYRESIRIGDRSTPPDLTQSSFGAVLDRGSYFQHCGIPDATSIRICAAVQKGRAVGVTVRTSPSNGRHQRCIANAVRGLSFPSHPRMDVTTTVFE